MEESFMTMEDMDNLVFDEAEYYDHLIQAQSAHYCIDTLHYVNETIDLVNELSNICDKMRLKLKKDHDESNLKTTTLNLRTIRTSEELELLQKKLEVTEEVSDDEIQMFNKTLESRMKENVEAELYLGDINKTIKLYECLNVRIESEQPDIVKAILLNHSKEPIVLVKVHVKKNDDYTRYEVLEQTGVPDDVFEKININLMRNDNFIEFLASLRQLIDNGIIV